MALTASIRFRVLITLALVFFLVTALVPASYTAAARPQPAKSAPGPDSAASARATTALHSSPVMFIENVGQFDSSARFQVRGAMGGGFWLTGDALWVTVLEPKKPEAEKPGQDAPLPLRVPAPQPRKGVNLKLSFTGSNPHPRLEPFGRLATSVNYFIGNDPAQWRTNVPAYSGLRYVDLYPGVDLEVTAEEGHWAWKLLYRQSGIANRQAEIRLRVEGADGVAPEGDRLRITTAVGEYTLPFPHP